MEKTLNRKYSWGLTLMKHSHPTVTQTLIPTWTLTLTVDMMKILLLQAIQMGHLECWWGPSFHWRSIQEAAHVNKNFTPFTIFFPFFLEVIQLLVGETIKYYKISI